MKNSDIVLLIEEASEIIQLGCKILRFGLDDDWNGKTNRELLEGEIGDFQAILERLNPDWDKIREHADKKHEKLKIYGPEAILPHGVKDI